MTENSSRLTPAMWRVLAGVGFVILVGVVVIAWLMMSSSAPDARVSAVPTQTSTAGPLPDATPTSGSEVIAPTDAADPTLPAIAPATPLVAYPFPPSASAQEELVTGFPREVIGLPPQSEVVENSIASEDRVMQASLVARATASEDDVRAYYTTLWNKLGLTEQPPSADGSISFIGSYESLTLAFTPSGTGVRFSVFGVFRAA